MIKNVILKLTVGLVIGAFSGLVVVNVGSEGVFAYGGEDTGGGNVGGKTSSGCTYGDHYTTSKCSDGTGGASWHIYEIDKRANTSGGPKYSSSRFSNNGWDYTTSEFNSTCPASRYTHYIAFGWDGWDGRNYNGDSKKAKKNVPTHWGPVHRGTCMEVKGGKCYKPTYNKNNLHSASEIKERLNAGKSVNGWRMTDATALKIYKRWRKNASSISNSVGYFCVQAKATLIATAIDEQGNVLSSKFDTDKYSAVLYSDNKNLVVDKSKFSKEGYTFKGWVLDKANAGNESKYVKRTDRYKEDGEPYLYYRSANNKKFYVNARRLSDSQDYKGTMTVYAVYGPGDCTGDCCPGDAGYPNCSTTTTTDNLCGEWGSVTPGVTSTLSQVRNASVETYADWSGSVYAKPTDKIYWQHCYYPGVQTMAFELATPLGSHVNDLTHDETPGDCGGEWVSYCPSLSSYEFTNMMLSSGAFGIWTNKFDIRSGSDRGSYSSTYNGSSRSFPIGDSTGQSFDEPSNSNVATRDVGATLNEKITTGSPISASTNDQGPNSWSCKWGKLGRKVHHHTPTYSCNCTTDKETGQQSCSTCGGDPVEWDYYGWTDTCRHNTSFISSEIDKNTTETQADVLVPYNFENNTEITTDANEVMFAGETFGIDFDINVDPRDNETLGNGMPYATKVDGAKSRLKVCPDGMECTYTNYKSESSLSNFTSMSDFENGYGIKEQTSIVVPDIIAGQNVCVQAQVYPVDSHDDLNMSQTAYPESDESSWAQSEFVCFVVAKRPSIQVIGGNVFSQNQIITSVATKNHLSGEPYSPSSGGNSGVHVFGSWGELGIVANGGVSGFGSGASLGYASGTNPSAVPGWPGDNSSGSVGGSNLTNHCNRSRLTFANDPCSVMGLMKSTANATQATEYADLLFHILEAQSAAGFEFVDYDSVFEDEFSEGGNVVNITEDDVSIDSPITTNLSNTIRVIRASDHVYINANVEYVGNYMSIEQIPKIIIYADEVNIACGVTRVDAVIIGRSRVDTCYDGADDEDGARSVQLMVNGAIVTDTLYAGRTYGAATGKNSIVPAEIINFDPALYQFGGNVASDSDQLSSGRLDVTYIHEVAPRL